VPPDLLCAVPLDGVAPTDESVRSLAYPDAYPITYLQPRWRKGTRTHTKAVALAFARWLGSPKVRAIFAQRGMLAP
jgi:hypothetical protein